MPQADLETVERLAEAGHSPDDPGLLGWYFLRRDDATQAERWFCMSYDRKPAAASAEGLALVLMKKYQDAEAILAPWRDANDDAGKAYMAAAANLLAEQPPPAIAPDVLARIVEAAKRRDPSTAQQLGWYSRAGRRNRGAMVRRSARLEAGRRAVRLRARASRRGAPSTRRAEVGCPRWGERSPRILALVQPPRPRGAGRPAAAVAAASATAGAPREPATVGAQPKRRRRRTIALRPQGRHTVDASGGGRARRGGTRSRRQGTAREAGAWRGPGALWSTIGRRKPRRPSARFLRTARRRIVWTRPTVSRSLNWARVYPPTPRSRRIWRRSRQRAPEIFVLRSSPSGFSPPMTPATMRRRSTSLTLEHAWSGIARPDEGSRLGLFPSSPLSTPFGYLRPLPPQTEIVKRSLR